MRRIFIIISTIFFVVACGSKDEGPSQQELDKDLHIQLTEVSTEIELHLIKNERDSVMQKVKLLVHNSDATMPKGSESLATKEGWKKAFTTHTYRSFWDLKRKEILDALK
jgi:hypothetical protein